MFRIHHIKSRIALITALIVSAAGINSGFAQSDEKLISGGFANLYVGPSSIKTLALTNYLREDDKLGADYKPASYGFTFGGEFMTMYGKYLFGTGGFAIIKPSTATDKGSAGVAINGAYLKMAYKLHQTADHLFFIYTAFGANSYSLRLMNHSDSLTINFNKKKPLRAGSDERYSCGGFLFDAGLSVKTLAISARTDSGKKAGFLIGFDLGMHLTLPFTQYRSKENIVVGPPDPQGILSPYLRISLGGGGF